MKPAVLRFAAPVFLLFAVAVFLHFYGGTDVIPTRTVFALFPYELGPWSGTDLAIDPEELDVLKPTDYLSRDYVTKDDRDPHISLFIPYFASQRTGDAIHSPQNCVPGAGWTPVESIHVTLSLPGHGPFPVTRYIVAKGDERDMVLYWYWAHDRGVASEYWAKYYLVADSMRMHRSDGALVRIITPMYSGETAETAEQRLLPFAAQVVPLLGDYIPR